MRSYQWIAVPLLLCLAACKSPPPPKNAPSGPDPADQEQETEPIKAPETSAPTPGASESATPAVPTEPGAKPACSSLQKSTCKVTVGCAWFEKGAQGKCVDQ